MVYKDAIAFAAILCSFIIIIMNVKLLHYDILTQIMLGVCAYVAGQFDINNNKGEINGNKK
jgi:hypothetical protein